MPTPEETQKIVLLIAALATLSGAIVALIRNTEEILKRLKVLWNEILKPLWNKMLKPGIKLLAFLGTQIIPNGIIVWVFLYKAAENSNRLTEPLIFLLLIAQATALLSLYSIVWGMWLCPRLRLLFVSQKRNPQCASGSNPPNEDNKPKSSPSSLDEYQ